MHANDCAHNWKEIAMNKIDDLINEALSNEDQMLLERFGKEPGFFKQAFSLFGGRLGWVMWLVGVVQLALLAAAIYAFWQTATTSELMHAVRWGTGAVILVQLSVLLRSFMGMHFEANRVLRGVQRVDLRLARLEGK
jgi:hypothetical protein